METLRQKRIRELKREFDRWFAEVKKLFPDAYTVEEEDELITLVHNGRAIQLNLLNMLESLDFDFDDNS